MVSTIKEDTHYGRKMMIIEFLDLHMNPIGAREIALDAADAGIGDIVITSKDGGSAKMLFDDTELISDITICGVLDHYSLDGKIIKTT